MNWLEDRIAGVVTGSAIGDALGGATEGYSPAVIQERYHGRVTGIVPPFHPDWPTHRPISPYHKGDGHVTDDTLMTQALIEVYADRRDHLDVFAIAESFVPQLTEKVRWIPELERETVLLNRVFLAEKWLVARLLFAHADPREGGVGNIVNCGAAMYMSPVGAVNAGDPGGAYREAIEIAGAHQSSYGREAAGVYAAAVAAALSPGADIDGVIDACLLLAHDGTRAAIEAVVDAVKATGGGVSDDRLAAIIRNAVRPYDSVGERYREPALDARTPSRTKSIEELPVALGLLLSFGGSFVESVLAAVNYGRDADSIASMAGAIAGALGGSAVLPAEWVSAISQSSRMDFSVHSHMLFDAATEILELDRDRARRTVDRIAALSRAPEVSR